MSLTDKLLRQAVAEIERLNLELAERKYAEGVSCGYCSHCGSLALGKIERLRAIVDPIEELRGGHADYLTIHVRPNQAVPIYKTSDGQEAVTVVAAWTHWKEKWFWGDTLAEALQAAVTAKRAAEAVAINQGENDEQ